MRPFLCLFLPFILCFAGCKSVQTGGDTSEVLATDGQQKVCGGVRGNGNLMMAHYGALGHYHETYPPLDGLAGGSSGSITTFLYESMRMNPLLRECEGRSCTAQETQFRLSFLLKSMLGYADAYRNSDEVQALMYVVKGVDSLRQKFADRDFQNLMASDPAQAARSLTKVLQENQEFRGLFNAALIDPFQGGNWKNPKFHLNQLKANIDNFGKWLASDEQIFFFPGFINWEEFANRVGRIGNFYAGYGSFYPQAKMDKLLTACAEPMLGKMWRDSVALPAEAGLGAAKTCQDALVAIVGEYRQQNRTHDGGPERINDPIGKGMMAFASTSVLQGASIANYKKAFDNYQSGLPLDFAPKFDDIKAGYFGAEADLRRVAMNAGGYEDMRTQKFYSLGPQSWKTVLSTSPAEPSLADIRPLPGDVYSVGGWMDLSPSLILRNAGCDQVVYFTRFASISTAGFAGNIIKLLGASDQELNDLTSADPDRSPPSSFSLATGEAQAVWCTDWDNTDAYNIAQHFEVGYQANLYSDSPYFAKGASVSAVIAPGQGRRACIVP